MIFIGRDENYYKKNTASMPHFFKIVNSDLLNNSA
jgi:hypothetical protein